MAGVRGQGPGGLLTAEIGLSAPWLEEREEELVLETLRSGQLSLGPMIDRFEQALAERVGAPYVAAVSSGTAGLHLAVRLAGLGEGDEVVTTPFSFVASANCVLYEGATPVFVDIDPRTLNLDPAAVEAAITPRTKAILPVDIFGYPAEYAELEAIAERNGLALIEDACEALGAEYQGRPLGSRGAPAVFAFYPNKQMTTGEGGAVAVQTEEEWALLKSLSNQGRSDSGEWLTHSRLGYNYRLDDVSAALGLAQVEKLDRILELRAEVAGALCGASGRDRRRRDSARGRRRPQAVVVRLRRPGRRRDRPKRRHGEAGRARHRLEAIPAVDPPAALLARSVREKEGMFPVSEDMSRRSLALPFHTRLERADQERVAEALASSLR